VSLERRLSGYRSDANLRPPPTGVGGATIVRLQDVAANLRSPPTLCRWEQRLSGTDVAANLRSPPTLCRWSNDCQATDVDANLRSPPTLCRWSNDCQATDVDANLRLHRPCIGGAKIVRLQRVILLCGSNRAEPANVVAEQSASPTQGRWRRDRAH
jgi:hypothetical protein